MHFYEIMRFYEILRPVRENAGLRDDTNERFMSQMKV
jgi:hypothetical protein